MDKKRNIISLIVLILVGSFVTFYTSNLIMSDVSNMFYGVHNADCISSLPGFLFAIEFVVATIYLLRVTRRGQYKKKTILLYSKYLLILSAIGLASSIYSGVVVYDSIFAPYPFPGYTILGIIVHTLIIAGAIVVLNLAKNIPNDTEKRRIDFGYVVYSIAIFVIIFITYNRLGALMWGVTYIQVSSLWLTFPFYLSLLLPLALMIHILLYFFGVFNKYPVIAIVYDVIFLIVNAMLGTAVFWIGAVNTAFISAISPALSLERLWTKPVDNIIHFVVLLLIGLYCLYLSIKLYRKKKKGLVK